MVALGVLGLGGWLAWTSIRAAQTARAIEGFEGALAQNEGRAAARHLAFLSVRQPQHPELLSLRARFATRFAPAMAPPLWQQLLAQFPEKVEFRIPAVLNLIDLGNIKEAKKLQMAWEQKDPDHPATWRTGLAVAYAEGVDEEATRYARQLLEAEPDSVINQLNWAKLQLTVDANNQQEAAIHWLEDQINHPDFGSDAIQALLTYHTRHLNIAALRDLEKRLQPPTDAATRLAFLEARQRTGYPPDFQEIQAVWEAAGPNDLLRSQLAGWLVETGKGQRVFDLTESLPDRWAFPLGLSLAEASIQTGRTTEAIAALMDADWPGLEYLKLFTQARLLAFEQSPNTESVLNLALHQAGSRPGGLIHLTETARAWNWRGGYEALLRVQLENVPAGSPQFKKFMTQAETQGDLTALLIGSQRMLEAHPDHVPSLNNLAYFAYLLGNASSQELEQARRARQSCPHTVAFTVTQLLLELELGSLKQASRLAATLPMNSPHAALARGLLARRKQARIQERDLELLQEHVFAYAEEEELKARLLQRASEKD